MAELISMLAATAGQGGVANVDPNFNQTVLLLHGDGSDGAQNNTFLDSSTNNFTVTRNGNTTQGTFSPFSLPDGYWAMYNAGGNSKIAFPDNAAFQLGSGDFTLEVWVNFDDFSTSQIIVNKWDGATNSAATSWLFNVSTSTTVRFDFRQSDGSTYRGNTFDLLTTLQVGTWYHIAITREGDDFKCWLNGVLQDTVNTPYTINNGSRGVTIGYNSVGPGDFRGYVSNVRLVKGTALYTSAFTPSTTPLTAISGTSLLTCQDNRFVDNSSNAFAVTVTGTPKVTPFSPFAPTAAYSPSVNGGSAYGDGTGDYLYTSSSVGLGLATQEWTVSCWTYETTTTGFHLLSISPNTSNVSSISIEGGANRRPVLQIYVSGTNRVLYQGTTGSVQINQWNHIALCHLGGGQYQFYVNGVAQTATSATGWYFNQSGAGAAGTGIGVYAYNNTGVLYGYMSDLVVKNGIDGSVPTAPVTSDVNTSLLCNFTNAGIYDSTGKNNLETVGNAQVDTSTVKFGTGSLEFDGTGDYLVSSESTVFNAGENFTVEAWVYMTDAGTYTVRIQKYVSVTEIAVFAVQRSTTSYAVFSSATLDGGVAASANDSTSTFSAATWTHIAWVMNAGTLTFYINGSASGTVSLSGYKSQPLKLVGITEYSAGGAPGFYFPFKGFIDDLRITKGVARYTSAFTPPTKEFPNL